MEPPKVPTIGLSELTTVAVPQISVIRAESASTNVICQCLASTTFTNATAAFATAVEMETDPDLVTTALANLRVLRRFGWETSGSGVCR